VAVDREVEEVRVAATLVPVRAGDCAKLLDRLG
jgi:hypothetical protein